MTLSLNSKRQLTARILAAAAISLLPKTQLLGGGETDFGFYYDFIFTQKVDQQFLILLEDRMRYIIAQNTPIETKSMMRENASDFFAFKKQEYLAEIVLELPENIVSIVKIDEFFDLCPEPHFPSTRASLVFKIHQMDYFEDTGVTRIECFAFETKDELKNFVKLFAKASKISFEKLGSDLGLIAKGAYLPKGVKLRNKILESLRKCYEEDGFEEIKTAKSVKALEHARLHKELGADHKFFELFELDGNTCDEATLYCSEDALIHELSCRLLFILKIIKLLDIEFALYLSHPKIPNRMKEEWGASLSSLEMAAQKIGLSYQMETTLDPFEESAGPRLVFRFKDVLGRQWDGSYVEVNKYYPKSLDHKISRGNGKNALPIMVRQVAMQSLEKVIVLLVEAHAGQLPVWLS